MSLIIQPNELDSNAPISCMIYGQPGCGKTSLAISSERPLLIDLDRGLHRVAAKNQCPSVQVTNYQQVLDILSSDDINDFQTIVIDTFGKLIDCMGIYICEQNPKLRQADGALTTKAWGAIKVRAHELVQQIFAKNKNVIFVAHEKEEKDGDDRILRPDVSGSSGKDLIQDLDLMGYMQMVGNKRTISFTPTHKFYAKNSLDLPPVIEVPNNSTRNDFYSKAIVEAVRKSREETRKIRSEYDKLIERHKHNIEMISCIEEFNMAFEAMKEDETIWDSTLLWKRALKAKADLMNIVFNAKLGVFENAVDNA